jgi:hypothetical protein
LIDVIDRQVDQRAGQAVAFSPQSLNENLTMRTSSRRLSQPPAKPATPLLSSSRVVTDANGTVDVAISSLAMQ